MNFRLLSIVMLLCLLTGLFSQDIISQNRRIDWQPGIPGGIPDYPAEVNVMDYGAAGNGIDDDTQAFKDAVTACSEEHAVYIPAGTYLITDRINTKSQLFYEEPIRIKHSSILKNNRMHLNISELLFG